MIVQRLKCRLLAKADNRMVNNIKRMLEQKRGLERDTNGS